MAAQGKSGGAGEYLLGLGNYLTRSEPLGGDRAQVRHGGRQGGVFYRDRWSHDRVVRSTHGVNCTGSCSWDVYVKDGIIAWETQATDYPSVVPDRPEYEPRGCPRGAAFSWYTYSPTRVRYPHARGVLVDMYREARERLGDPVLAWEEITTDPGKRSRYQRARGKGGLVRSTWDEALEIAAAAHVLTIKKYGPDRIAGFSPIPAMSMVWYVPPLSPVVDTLTRTGHDGESADNLFGAIDTLRIPIEYLAELFSSGDTAPVELVLRRLAAMRSYMRRVNLGQERDESIASAVGMTGTEIEDMYRLLALAKYDERYVVPTAFGVDESDRGVIEEVGCSLDFDGGPGTGGMGDVPLGEASGRPVAASAETFHALRERQTGDGTVGGAAATDGRVNLLNWDGNGRPRGLFPPRADGGTDNGEARGSIH
ncbi:molybdopterin-dependent oxidoreductase [Nocardiopsis nanhaiensis]